MTVLYLLRMHAEVPRSQSRDNISTEWKGRWMEKWEVERWRGTGSFLAWPYTLPLSSPRHIPSPISPLLHIPSLSLPYLAFIIAVPLTSSWSRKRISLPNTWILANASGSQLRYTDVGCDCWRRSSGNSLGLLEIRLRSASPVSLSAPVAALGARHSLGQILVYILEGIPLIGSATYREFYRKMREDYEEKYFWPAEPTNCPSPFHKYDEVFFKTVFKIRSFAHRYICIL